MTVRPIIFSAPMVRALLEGRKTQTRRVLKPQPRIFGNASKPYRPHPQIAPREWVWLLGSRVHCIRTVPYAPGDLLWCREAALPDFPKEFSHFDWSWREVPEEYRHPEHVIYRATWEGSPTGWRPSIHMPRWASRLTLRVTDVRVQRVQDISEEEAIAEGVRGNAGGAWGCEGLIEDFADLWNTLHKPPHDWSGDPWVSAITFDVIRKNVDEVEP